MADKSHNLVKGRKAENLALDFLIKKGYEILETNWRNKRAEIDIIAKFRNILIFIEVKSRSTDRYGAPELGVTSKKKAMLIAGATSYMEEIDYNWEIQFDIISVLYKATDQFVIEHYEDAFFPGIN